MNLNSSPLKAKYIHEILNIEVIECIKGPINHASYPELKDIFINYIIRIYILQKIITVNIGK